MQKVTNNNHVKFDIHMLDNMEVTDTFMFNLHIQTILAKIMWDACRMHCLDHRSGFSHGNRRSLGQILPSPLPPCNVVHKERLAEELSNIASGGKGGGGGGGGGANIAAIREKGTVSHTFWPGL